MPKLHTLQCIRNDSKLSNLFITLNCTEFTWNCPSVQQPDYGTIEIWYRPKNKIVETKSLKFYLQQYRYLNAYNEELVVRITQDFIYYVEPEQVKVILRQNIRGGISNTAECSWYEDQPFDYTPKAGFQGGWPNSPIRAVTKQAAKKAAK